MDLSITTSSLHQDKEHVQSESIEPSSIATATVSTDKHILNVSKHSFYIYAVIDISDQKHV